MHVAAYAGSLMSALMHLAVPPLDNNSFMDDHLAVAMLLLAYLHAGRTWGLGDWWTKHPVVRRCRWME